VNDIAHGAEPHDEDVFHSPVFHPVFQPGG